MLLFIVNICYKKLNAINIIIDKIPTSEIIKRKSAIVSNSFSRCPFDVRIEMNEKIQEKVSNTPTTDVNSSMKWVSVMLAICNEVITKRQKPRRFAEELRMCCEVLFAIMFV